MSTIEHRVSAIERLLQYQEQRLDEIQGVTCVLVTSLGKQEALLERHGSTLERHEALLERQGTLLERQGALLERQGAILERHEALLERQGTLLERQGALLERQGAILERHEAFLERHEALLEEIRRDARSTQRIWAVLLRVASRNGWINDSDWEEEPPAGR